MRENNRENDEVKKRPLRKKGRERFSYVLSQQDMKKRRFMRLHISTICPILKGIFAFLMKQHLREKSSPLTTKFDFHLML